jgi:hypothetical protein
MGDASFQGETTMKQPKILVYADIDDNGQSYMVYDDGQPYGPFLCDDMELRSFMDRGGEVVQGLDNRS